MSGELTYDAFISYSHAKDRPIAAALQSVVQRLGKPWYRRRALRLAASGPVGGRVCGSRRARSRRRHSTDSGRAGERTPA